MAKREEDDPACPAVAPVARGACMKTLIAVLTLALAALAHPVSAAPPELPVETHCVADETGAAHCSTTVADTCTVTTVAGSPSSISCTLPKVVPPANCSLGPMTPGGDTDCRATAGECEAHVHLYDVEDALNVYEVSCYDCGVHFGAGGVRCDLLAVDAMLALSGLPLASTQTVGAVTGPCQSGIAQTWCDASVGPCDVRVTPWTAWGDRSVEADCRGGSMTRCHAEWHTADPANPEQWCAF